MKRVFALAVALTATAGLLITGGASSAASSSLPTVTISLTGTSIAVGGTLTSGAVNVTSTTTNKDAEPTLVHLNPGVTADQALADPSVPRDPNNVSKYGQIVFDADAPHGTSTVQTILPAGNYVALDTQSNNPAKAPHTTFTVAESAIPAALPPAAATVHAIEFGFKSPKTLHNGSVVRFSNDGFLVHMIAGVGAKNASSAKEITALLKAGKDKNAQKLATGFANFLAPASHGTVQQMTLNAKPGYYVLACFMDTQDNREHTRLGMLKTIRVAK
jgi:hypothetical protein